jgi:hypothetical protein
LRDIAVGDAAVAPLKPAKKVKAMTGEGGCFCDDFGDATFLWS